MNRKVKLKYILLIFSLTIFTLANSWFYYQARQYKKEQDAPFLKAEKLYPHLAKRILIESPNDILIKFLGLRMALRKEVAAWGDSFAFYFEYLPTGVSVGVNEKIEFESGSLFKVPVVMAYLAKKERLGEKEDKTVELAEEQMDPRFGNLWKLGSGAKVNLAEAVKLALTESDNTAVNLLIREPEVLDYEHVYEGLDLDLKGRGGEPPQVTVKGFSSILKALYFSSVLSKENSELILNYLTKSKFHDQIVAGVPKYVPVAHKIGVFGESFMDCGIVYVPKRPYLVCMRSKSDQKLANERMSKISKIIYDYVSKQ